MDSERRQSSIVPQLESVITLGFQLVHLRILAKKQQGAVQKRMQEMRVESRWVQLSWAD